MADTVTSLHRRIWLTNRHIAVALLAVAYLLVGTLSTSGQDLPSTSGEKKSLAEPIPEEGAAAPPPEKIDVAPAASDEAIAGRLQRILDATGWFRDASVRVDEGVVFLNGTARDDEVKLWAGNLARRTEDVVAVANQLDVEQPSLWNLQPATQGIRALWRDTIAMLPFLAFGILILLVAWVSARLSEMGSMLFFRRRIASPLIRTVLSRTVGLGVLLLGLYIVLRVSGLTRLALTVLGGTGILGLVIGIAFRDITENFLASIFLSVRRPFLVGDLVSIVDVLGYVQRLTTRSTVLMALNGNYVEIPNSTVYKNTIRNFSTNKNRREDFTVGIGYEMPIAKAQEVALRVLREHPAVLEDPEPWALVDDLGSSAVVLRIYFWLDGSRHSWLKVKSSAVRQIKSAFQEAGITIPDDAREVIFPRGVPVLLRKEEEYGKKAVGAKQLPVDADQAAGRRTTEPATTVAEGGLRSDAEEIEEQARQARPLEGENLLNDQDDHPSF